MLAALMLRHAGRALAICLLLLTVLGQARAVEGPANGAYRLEVGYHPDQDQLSVHAEDAPLQKVADALADDASVLIEALDEELLLSERITAQVVNRPLQDAVHEVFGEFNTIFLNAPVTDKSAVDAGKPRLRVILISKRAMNTNGGDRDHSRAEAIREAGDADLLQSLLEKPEQTVAKLNTLSTAERDQAVERLQMALLGGDSVNETDGPAGELLKSHAASMAALEALDQLDPQKATETAARWLDQANNQRLRLAGAAGLGKLGREDAIPVLSPLLKDPNALVSQAAANSLAQIGTEHAVNTLIDANQSGDDALQRTTATAVLRHGNRSSQNTVAQQLTGSAVPADRTAQDIIVEYLSESESAVFKQQSYSE